MKSAADDASAIASSIKYHADFTPSFSPEIFDLSKTYFAAAQSVRDALIINWNATYEYYEKMNVKQAYYLSMEFLQVQWFHSWCCKKFNLYFHAIDSCYPLLTTLGKSATKCHRKFGANRPICGSIEAARAQS